MKKINICIVEDMPEIRQELENIIRSSAELQLQASFSSAEDALEDIAALQPDIVIMDINLPRMDGISCVKQASALSPQTQFMMFTIFENSDQVFDALAAGASGYLLKNTPGQKMIESIVELYNGGSPMSAQIARKLVTTFQQKDHQVNEDFKLLSKREKEIMELLAKGFLYKEVADKLSITTGTVRQHIHNIYEKLHVQNRTEALNKIYKN
ncbi:MAG: two component transcriptional regulator, LuxR family [Crocinitomicaceae bacterium]|jgi:DNA-binding NarL/FixJ family response regulator|nr:two component transcriptional regulator, LuxR family [Crocinitomicaceae bacterium]